MTIEVTTTAFLGRYPEFQSVNRDYPDMVSGILLESVNQINDGNWEAAGGYDKAVRAASLYTAHLLSVRLKEIQEMAGGAVSLARGESGRSPYSGQDHLSESTYGRQYQELRRQISPRSAVY